MDHPRKRKIPLNSLPSTLPMINSCPSSGTCPNSNAPPPPPMRAGPDQRNRSLRCDYHRDHGHETNQCQSLKFLIERLIRAGHLRRYLREPSRGATATPTSDRAVVEIQHAPEPRPTINFILGGPADNEYQSKKQRRRMLRTALVRARINTVIDQGSTPTIQPVDGPISFPPVNPTRVITSH